MWWLMGRSELTTQRELREWAQDPGYQLHIANVTTEDAGLYDRGPGGGPVYLSVLHSK